MPSSSADDIPATPRVISPSPVPSSESSSRDGYAGLRTRSAARRQRLVDVSEEKSEDVDADSTRSRSRSPAAPARLTRTRRSNPMIPARKPEPSKTNGRISPTDLLSPNSALGKGRAHDISRSPSPLGLIPLHTRYRSFIHRHEIPRKLLHGSIGFLTLICIAEASRLSRSPHGCSPLSSPSPRQTLSAIAPRRSIKSTFAALVRSCGRQKCRATTG